MISPTKPNKVKQFGIKNYMRGITCKVDTSNTSINSKLDVYRCTKQRYSLSNTIPNGTGREPTYNVGGVLKNHGTENKNHIMGKCTQINKTIGKEMSETFPDLSEETPFKENKASDWKVIGKFLEEIYKQIQYENQDKRDET